MVDAVDFEGAVGHLIGQGAEPASGVLDFLDCGFLGQFIPSLPRYICTEGRSLVPGGGFEPPLPKELGPKPSASASSATRAIAK